MERNYIAFISYRHTPLDMAAAKQLHGLIEQYTIPKQLRHGGQKKLGIVFRDQEELPASSDLSRDICSALDNSEFLIVICTPDTPQSIWVEREIRYFLQNHDRNHILTVLAEGEPSEAFPKILTQTYNGQEIEPLAADVRAKNTRGVLSKLRRECRRLFAAMLGCPYDAIVLREQRRQRRRTLAFTAAVLTVAISFSAVLLVKNKEISQKNTELAQQKAEVQQRESQLLTANAQEAMAGGDYLAAVENAVSALPREGDEDRPYYAPAESVLMEALDVFGNSDSRGLLRSTTLEQMTPISEFGISSDGSQLVTMDLYGTLTCFDTVNGALLWSAAMGDGGTYDRYSSTRLFFHAKENLVVGYYDHLLEAYALETGQLLWTAAIPDANEYYLFCSDESGLLVYVDEIYTGGSPCYRFDLTVLSMQSGQVVNSIPILETDSYVTTNFTAGYDDVCPRNGVFSEDGTLFAGSYIDSTDDAESTLSYFVADLAADSVSICFSQTLPDAYYYLKVTRMEFRDDNSALLILREGADHSVAVTAEKIDISSGTPLWQSSTPAETEEWYFYDKASCALFWDSILYAARGDRMYAIDPATGQCLYQVSLYADIVAMEDVETFFFSFLLADGYHAVGWCNDSGLHDSSSLGINCPLASTQCAAIYNGSFLRAVTADNRITDFLLDSGENAGYVALIPEEDDHKILIYRPVSSDSLLSQTLLTVPNADSHSGEMTAAACGENTLILGPFYRYADDTYSIREYTYTAVNTDTFAIIGSYSADPYTDTDEIFFLPDGSGYILCTSDGSITLAQETSTVLSSHEDSYVEVDGYLRSLWNVFCATSNYQAENGDVLTARCDADTLTLWQNGEPLVQTDLPVQLCYDFETEDAWQRFLKVGANGYVLTGLCLYESNPTLSEIAAYDTGSGAWLPLQGDTVCANPGAIAISGESPLFAMVDDSNLVHVYNLQTGEAQTSFPLQLPASALIQLDFLLEDSCLIARTADSQVLIFDVSTGAICYRQVLDTSYDAPLGFFVDEENHRLYVTDGTCYADRNGFCLDLRSWTKLADVSDMLYFDPEDGVLCRIDSSSALSFVTVPDTAELVEIARQLLGNT